jgi:molybdopterin molybdotransferase
MSEVFHKAKVTISLAPFLINLFLCSFSFFPSLMLPVAEASRIIQSHLLNLPDDIVPIDEAVGRVLRQSLSADRDVPTFDRVTMDGIAFRYEAFASGQRTFVIEGRQFAGKPPQALQDPNACLEVMTGAVLPTGADTIVRYEDLNIADGQATVQVDEVTPGMNVHAQATDKRTGDLLLAKGTLIRAVDAAVGASVGAATVRVAALPRIAIIATGDELVEVGEMPALHQIRHTNTYAIQAALRSLGIRGTIHHLIDDPDLLREGVSELLAANDMLILSGGVSAGKADYVPETMAALNVQCHFHQIKQRPGKPIWFGSTEGDLKVVFGLPGNPVSTTMCVYKYVLPHLRASMGQAPVPITYAQLAEPVTFRPALTYFLPVRLESTPQGLLLGHPLPGSGSGDYTNLTEANAFLQLPAEQTDFAAGESFEVIGFRDQ